MSVRTQEKEILRAFNEQDELILKAKQDDQIFN